MNKHELIDNFIKEFKETKSFVLKLKESYKAEDFKKQPDEGKWNAGDCLEHLNKTNEGYIRNAIEKLTSVDKSNAENANYKPRFLMKKFINMMKPDNTMKFKAPGAMKEDYKGNLEATVNRFLKVQDDYISLAERAREYDLREKVTSPVTKLLKLQLGEMFMAMIEHQKRHLQQAERALES